ncbi:MAG: hypothetical protein L6461_20735 [Anaerolineae bacterium]|nr:hypothetical protein [Anaerolineae bacterium]
MIKIKFSFIAYYSPWDGQNGGHDHIIQMLTCFFAFLMMGLHQTCLAAGSCLSSKTALTMSRPGAYWKNLCFDLNLILMFSVYAC